VGVTNRRCGPDAMQRLVEQQSPKPEAVVVVHVDYLECKVLARGIAHQHAAAQIVQSHLQVEGGFGVRIYNGRARSAGSPARRVPARCGRAGPRARPCRLPGSAG
jgi:hypothetical protein